MIGLDVLSILIMRMGLIGSFGTLNILPYYDNKCFYSINHHSQALTSVKDLFFKRFSFVSPEESHYLLKLALISFSSNHIIPKYYKPFINKDYVPLINNLYKGINLSNVYSFSGINTGSKSGIGNFNQYLYFLNGNIFHKAKNIFLYLVTFFNPLIKFEAFSFLFDFNQTKLNNNILKGNLFIHTSKLLLPNNLFRLFYGISQIQEKNLLSLYLSSFEQIKNRIESFILEKTSEYSNQLLDALFNYIYNYNFLFHRPSTNVGLRATKIDQQNRTKIMHMIYDYNYSYKRNKKLPTLCLVGENVNDLALKIMNFIDSFSLRLNYLVISKSAITQFFNDKVYENTSYEGNLFMYSMKLSSQNKHLGALTLFQENASDGDMIVLLGLNNILESRFIKGSYNYFNSIIINLLLEKLISGTKTSFLMTIDLESINYSIDPSIIRRLDYVVKNNISNPKNCLFQVIDRLMFFHYYIFNLNQIFNFSIVDLAHWYIKKNNENINAVDNLYGFLINIIKLINYYNNQEFQKSNGQSSKKIILNLSQLDIIVNKIGMYS